MTSAVERIAALMARHNIAYTPEGDGEAEAERATPPPEARYRAAQAPAAPACGRTPPPSPRAPPRPRLGPPGPLTERHVQDAREGSPLLSALTLERLVADRVTVAELTYALGVFRERIEPCPGVLRGSAIAYLLGVVRARRRGAHAAWP